MCRLKMCSLFRSFFRCNGPFLNTACVDQALRDLLWKSLGIRDTTEKIDLYPVLEMFPAYAAGTCLARSGDNFLVLLLFSGVERCCLSLVRFFVSLGTVKSLLHVLSLLFLTKEEVVPVTSIFPDKFTVHQFYFRTTDIFTGVCSAPEGTEMVMPLGDNNRMDSGRALFVPNRKERAPCALPFVKADIRTVRFAGHSLQASSLRGNRLYIKTTLGV